MAASSVLMTAFGCVGVPTAPVSHEPIRRTESGYVVKPVLAVSEFENRSNFAGKWNLPESMADTLVTALLDTGKVVVLERKHLQDVMNEIARQNQGGLSRPEGRVERGRLKNARFLVRGVITDFTVTGDASGWFGKSESRGLLGGAQARVAINLSVSDVESGQIVSSVRAEGSAGRGYFSGAVNYREIAFGGDAFFQTPLGEATEEALENAVEAVLRDLPERQWQPRVAALPAGEVVVNGGRNTGLKEGDEFLVRGEGERITDPTTGDVIETLPGPETGRIRVREVRETSARAELLSGNAREGDYLERVPGQ